MAKNIFLFSGQGSQYPGMGLELAKKYPSAQRIYDCAGDMLGINLKEICETASEDELAQTDDAEDDAVHLGDLGAVLNTEVDAGRSEEHDGGGGHSNDAEEQKAEADALHATTILGHRSSFRCRRRTRQRGARAQVEQRRLVTKPRKCR